MTHTLRFLAMALGLLALGACKKAEAPAPALVELKAPDNADSLAWRMYMTEVVKRHMDGVSESPFMYFLPSADSEDFQGLYDRQLENIAAVVSRTVLPGNMLAFGSPDPAKMADLIEAAFQGAPADSMKDVRVLFIGTPEQGERVRAAVELTGAVFVLHELQ